MKTILVTMCAMAAVLSTAGSLRAGLLATVDFATTMDMPFMSVGNTGNSDDIHGSGYGAVNYAYGIGKFEVTAGQYTEFLNAVAADDTYALYNERMADPTSCRCRVCGLREPSPLVPPRPLGKHATWQAPPKSLCILRAVTRR